MVGGGGDVWHAVIRATHAEAERRADRPGGKFGAVTAPPRWWQAASARRVFPLMAAPNPPGRRVSRCVFFLFSAVVWDLECDQVWGILFTVLVLIFKTRIGRKSLPT